MKHKSYLLSLLLALIVSACSTTSNLPGDEQLYTGIHHLDYLSAGEQPRRLKADTTGVITAIGDMAMRIDEALRGTGEQTEANALTNDDLLSPEERKEARRLQREAKAREAEALEAAKVEVNAVLEYPPNNSLFGSAYHRVPFPLGLWVHNHYANSNGAFAKWMNKSFGTDPVLISSVSPETRIKVATNTLRNFGYFHGEVKYFVEPSARNSRKAKMNYYVKPGPLYTLDSISFVGFHTIADSLINATRHQSYLKSGDAFSVLNLTNEQTRIADMLRDCGYYYYKAGNTIFQADTFAVPQRVQLRATLNPNLPDIIKRPYTIGNTLITVLRHMGDTATTSRTIRSVTYNYSGNKPPLYLLVWLQNIAHRPGKLYRQRDEERTREMLSSLGIFSEVDVRYVRRNTTQAGDTLDLAVVGILDKPYTSSLELNLTMKNADRIGPGLNYTLQKRNAFRGGELLNFSLFGNYEWRTQNDRTVSRHQLFNSYEAGTQLSLEFPRIVFPGISRRRFFFPTSTNFSFNTDLLNRAEYFYLFSINLKASYAWNKKRTSRHELTPFSLTYDKLLRSTAQFDSIMNANPALSTSLSSRFVPAIQYTYTYTSSRRHRNPLWWQLSVKEAGNITSGIYALAGCPFNEQNKLLFNNPFAQYVKLTTELHNNFKVRGKHKIVTRVRAGIVYSYGNSLIAPYNDQFYVGGANSIRGFTMRTVGPGRFYKPHSRHSYLDQTGDLTFETNAEYRFPVFGGINGALFFDAGNVWLLRHDEERPGGQFKFSKFIPDLALSTGAGVRYDLDFLVIRLDLGVALHDPANNGRRGYFNAGSFTDRLALHFAIGYPF